MNASLEERDAAESAFNPVQLCGLQQHAAKVSTLHCNQAERVLGSQPPEALGISVSVRELEELFMPDITLRGVPARKLGLYPHLGICDALGRFLLKCFFLIFTCLGFVNSAAWFCTPETRYISAK